MRSVLIGTTFAILYVAGSVAANAANTTPNPTTPPAYAAPVIADANNMKAADDVHHTNIRQQLQDQLTTDGYTGITITPSSFFVEAKDKKGEPVAMVIGPDSFTEVTTVAAKAPATTAQRSSNTTAPQK